MSDFELFLNFFDAQHPNSSLRKSLDAWDDIQAWEAYKNSPTNTLSSEVIAFLRAGKKISAIKQHRKENMDAGRSYGLKESKDIMDAALEADPKLKAAQRTLIDPKKVGVVSVDGRVWIPSEYDSAGNKIDNTGLYLADWEANLLGYND